MTKKTGMMLVGGVGVIALLCFIVIKMMSTNIWAVSLTEAEVRDKIGRQYGGEIIDMVRHGEQYEVELMQESGMYTLSLDAKNGEVVSLQQTERFDPVLPPDRNERPNQPDGSNDPTNDPTEPAAPPNRITASEAAQIAVNEIGGVVDDIDLEEMGGSLFYLIEIELHDDLEAVVQVDSLTGAIISISWDD